MNNLEKIKNESIKEYGTAVVQERYKKVAVRGFWKSEEILVKKYFKENSHILDMACGSGRTALPLHKLGIK